MAVGGGGTVQEDLLFTAGGVECFGGERKEGFDAHGFEGRKGGRGFRRGLLRRAFFFVFFWKCEIELILIQEPEPGGGRRSGRRTAM